MSDADHSPDGPAWPRFSCVARVDVLDFGPLVGLFGQWTGSQRRVLADFRQLHALPETRIAAFAERYGRLGLDDHGIPMSNAAHAPGSESLEAWRYWSRRADAILMLADAVKTQRGSTAARVEAERAARVLVEIAPWETGQLGAALDGWRDMWLEHAIGHRPAVTQRRRWPRMVASAVRQWTGYADTRPTLAYGPLPGGGVAFAPELEFSGLFGLLGRLLTREVLADPDSQRTPETAACRGCGQEFQRWQAYGPACYCRRCHEDKRPAWRRASASYKARRRAARASDSHGGG